MTPEKSNPVLAGLYAGVCVGLGLFLIAASPSPTRPAFSPTNSSPQQVTTANFPSTNSAATTTTATPVRRGPAKRDEGGLSAVAARPLEWSIEFFQPQHPQQPLKCPPDLEPIPATGGPATGGLVETDAASGLPLKVKNDLNMVFRLIPSGDFSMGSSDGDSDEAPIRKLKISVPFYLMESPVSNVQYERFQANHKNARGAYARNDQDPATRITWHDALAYCQWLNTQLLDTSPTSHVTRPSSPSGCFRPPTEAEYEKAARGGLSQMRYPWGDAVPASEKTLYSPDGAAEIENEPEPVFFSTSRVDSMPEVTGISASNYLDPLATLARNANRLSGVTNAASQVEFSSRHTRAGPNTGTCAEARECLNQHISETPYGSVGFGIIRDWQVADCTNVGSFTQPSSPIITKFYSVRKFSAVNFLAQCVNIRGKIQSDLSNYPSGTPVVYLKLGLVGGNQASDFGQTRPTSAENGNWGKWSGGFLTLGQLSTTDFVTKSDTDPVDEIPGDCSAIGGADAGTGWQINGQIVEFFHAFTNNITGSCTGCTPKTIAITDGPKMICVGTSNNLYNATVTGITDPLAWAASSSPPGQASATNGPSATQGRVIGIAASAKEGVTITAAAEGVTSDPYKITVVGVESLTVNPGGHNIGGPTNLYCWASNQVIVATAKSAPELEANELPGCWSFTGGTVSNAFVHTVDQSVVGITTLIAKAGSMALTNVIVVEKVTLTGKALACVGETNQWTAGDSQTNYHWSSSAPLIAPVVVTNAADTAYAQVIGRSPGTAAISVAGWNGKGCSVSSNAYVVLLDLAMQGTTEATEEVPGAFICADASTNTARTPLTVTFNPGNLSEGNLKLEASGGNLKLWDAITNGTVVTLPWTLPITDTTPITTNFYARAVENGQTDLILTYTKGSESCNDKVKVSVKKVDKGVAWGSVHWQYLEDMTKVTPYEGTPLKLKKTIFTKKQTKKGPVLEAMKGALEVGDELVVRIELRVDRDMEYIHMKDQRGSGLEPLNVISHYKYQDGLAYYESTRDTASHFFINYLPKGVYVFEYSTRVVHRGNYQTGIAEIQCMYAPEFNSHSESFALEVR